MASATRLLATFLQHYKGSRLSFAEISQRAASLADRKRAEAFLAVFRPVFERYQELLARSGTIDFHDMINRATDFVLRNPAQIRKTVRPMRKADRPAVHLGLCSGKHGFPSEITDDPLLDLVLAAPEAHPNAEERRLLYVAISRARRQVYLLAEGGPPSSFARELMHGRYDVNVFGRLPQADVPCPQCKEGRLERRENPRSGSTFYGCSNWPYCRLTRPPCPSCGIGLAVKAGSAHRCRDCGELLEGCPDCDGWLETKMGRYGRFLGCSNWPGCGYTRNLRSRQERGTENSQGRIRSR